MAVRVGPGFYYAGYDLTWMTDGCSSVNATTGEDVRSFLS